MPALTTKRREYFATGRLGPTTVVVCAIGLYKMIRFPQKKTKYDDGALDKHRAFIHGRVARQTAAA
jgi:hypothetical protein